MALHVKLDVNWVNHDKVIAVGLAGAGLHAGAMCLAKQLETDGVLSRQQLARIGATNDLIDVLLAEGLFDWVDDRRVRVHDWLDRNPAAQDFSEHGRRGNHTRYKHAGPYETCPRCSPLSGGDRGEPDGPGPEAETPTGDISTEDGADGPFAVDKPTGSETSSSVAMARGGETGRLGGRSGGESPKLLESDSESDSESKGEPPRFARGLHPTIAACFDLLTVQAMLANPTQNGNTDRHRTAVLAGITKDLAPTAYLILAKEPDIEPQSLADRLRPPAGSPPALAIAHPAAPEPGRRYDIASEADTAVRLAEQRAFAPPDPEAVKAAAAKARHAIAHPDAPTEDPTEDPEEPT